MHLDHDKFRGIPKATELSRFFALDLGGEIRGSWVTPGEKHPSHGPSPPSGFLFLFSCCLAHLAPHCHDVGVKRSYRVNVGAMLAASALTSIFEN